MHRNQFDGTSGANFIDWREQSRSIAVMTVYRRASASRVIVAGADGPERAQKGLVGPEFFQRRTRRAIPPAKARGAPRVF